MAGAIGSPSYQDCFTRGGDTMNIYNPMQRKELGDPKRAFHHNPPKPFAMAERAHGKTRFPLARATFSSARFNTCTHQVVKQMLRANKPEKGDKPRAAEFLQTQLQSYPVADGVASHRATAQALRALAKRAAD